MQAAANVQPSSPAWLSGVIGLAGVIIGIGAKWLLDSRQRKHQEIREDKLRFANNRLTAFTEFLSAVVAERGSYIRLQDARREADNTELIALRTKDFEEANLLAMHHQQTIEILSPKASSVVRECMRLAVHNDHQAFGDALDAVRKQARTELA